MPQPAQQTFNFQNSGPTTINNNFTEPPGESETAPVTFKLKDTTRQELKDFCFDHDLSLSEYVREAVQFYRQNYPQKDKLKKYHVSVSALLKTLP